jgi:hypothetical protein
MHRFDEICNLTGSDRVMPNIALNDSGGEVRIGLLRGHVSGFWHQCVSPTFNVVGPAWGAYRGGSVPSRRRDFLLHLRIVKQTQ